MKYKLFFFGCLLMLLGCNKQMDISNFDEQTWKADKMACDNKRAELVKGLLSSKEEFIDLSQQEIVATLGRPEMQELYTRGQKFFIYHLSPGPKCNGQNSENKSKLLYIRFSALNEVSEVFIK